MEHESRSVSLEHVWYGWWMDGLAYLLDHVEYLLGPVEPDIMVWYGHGLEGDLLGILEVGIGSPDSVEPFYWEKLVLSGHVLGQPQAVVIPLLAKEYVRNIRLQNGKDLSQC